MRQIFIDPDRWVWYNLIDYLMNVGRTRMETLFTVLLFIFAITLIVLVLIQPDRSHGTSASMGLGASNTVFGISKDGGPLAKATEVVATLFILSALLLYLVK